MEQLIVFFILLTIATHFVFSEENCRILQFLSPIDGSALENHAIRTIALNSEHFCRVQCYLDYACVSYNFGKRVTGEDVCELNNSTYREHPQDLKMKTNFIYRGSQNSCGAMPCMNGGTCQSGFLPHGYRCLCAAGFIGLQCETNIDECASSPCLNGGSCHDLANGFKCDCTEGYFGARCETGIPECLQYKFLNDSDRHRDYHRAKKCDRNLPEDWYRFYAEAGTRIATYCVSTHSCGTDLTGWMNEAHPTVDEGAVARTVCFHGYSKCCYKRVRIDVRNCRSFFVYRLKTLTFCNARYCGSN